jgi:hypothetical protein
MKFTPEQLKKLSQMFILQDKLNVEVYDKNWYKNRTKQDLVRAIWTESVELMNSLPWKWWAAPNMKNAVIESIDLWHFVMSYILLENKGLENINEFHLTKVFLNGLNWESIKLETVLDDVNISYIKTEIDQNKRLLFLTENVAKCFLNFQADMGIFYFGMLVTELLTFEKLYLFYLGKNILNTIRQEKGYKSGVYKKVIDGKEDNDYLYELVNRVKNTTDIEKDIREAFSKLN